MTSENIGKKKDKWQMQKRDEKEGKAIDSRGATFPLHFHLRNVGPEPAPSCAPNFPLPLKCIPSAIPTRTHQTSLKCYFIRANFYILSWRRNDKVGASQDGVRVG